MEYGLIGKPLSQSFSPFLHEKLGSFPYECRELSPDELADFFAKRDFCGINVTVPYKKAVIPFLDELSPEAKEIGSVNTILNRGGRLYGYNTDFDGFSALLRRENVDLSGKTVLILGSGGTAATVKAVCHSENASAVFCVSRTPAGNLISYAEAEKMGSTVDVIINTTPCGMMPDEDETPLSLDAFPKLSAAVDVIYRPLRTKFLLEAKEKNIPAVGGLYMLSSQAVSSAELFLDKKFPPETAETLYRGLLQRERNLILTGLPASGKTTVGKLLAEKLDMPFFDSDGEIEKRFGLPIPEIFEKYGEPAFRKAEEEILLSLSKKRGAVIATGGGAVLSEKAMAALQRSGFVIFLDRPVASLFVGEGRPTAPDRKTLAALSEKRRPHYLRFADQVFSGDMPPEIFSDAIIESYKEQL